MKFARAHEHENGETERAQANEAPSARACRPRVRTKTFKEGSTVILDQQGGIIGMIEARTPYHVRRRAETRRLANRHR